jgi:hypothetical protein
MRLWIKFILGLLSHGFLLSMGLFVGYLFPGIIQLSQSRTNELPPDFLIYIPLVLVGSLSILIPIAVFIVYLFKNPKFSSTVRLVWILLLAFFPVLAAPVFFWAVIFRHPTGEAFFGKTPDRAHA